LQLDPKNALAVGNPGPSLCEKSDYYRAIWDFNEAIRLNPSDDRAFCRNCKTENQTDEYLAARRIQAAGTCNIGLSGTDVPRH
jgi:hypothetical protein